MKTAEGAEDAEEWAARSRFLTSFGMKD